MICNRCKGDIKSRIINLLNKDYCDNCFKYYLTLLSSFSLLLFSLMSLITYPKAFTTLWELLSKMIWKN